MISPDVYFDYESQEHSQSNHKNLPQEFLAGALHIATTMSTYYHFYADNFGLHWSCGNMWVQVPTTMEPSTVCLHNQQARDPEVDQMWI